MNLTDGRRILRPNLFRAKKMLLNVPETGISSHIRRNLVIIIIIIIIIVIIIIIIIIQKEYYRRVRKILKSKLNGGNIVKAVNLSAVSMVRYGAGIIDWKKDELKEMDKKTRKLFTIYRALHPQADFDKLYLKRSEGGRGLLSIEECVIIETNSLVNYTE